MWTSMLALWTGLPTWAKKLLEYAALAILFIVLIRWYSNAQYEKGVASGRIDATNEVLKSKKAEWDLQEKALTDASNKIVSDRAVLDAQSAEIVQARASMSTELSKKLNSINNTKEKTSAIISTVPDAQLDTALRNLSADLARDSAAKPVTTPTP